jgi:hypothetical protein
LVNRTDVSIHHFVNTPPFLPVAFIFDEPTPTMVNRQCARQIPDAPVPRVNPVLKHAGIKGIDIKRIELSKSWGV